MDDCTIVIPIHNSLHVVRPCLESVLAWTDLSTHQVVLVDDGSDAHTADVLALFERRSPNITVLTNPRNIGFVRSCNRVLNIAETSFVVLLNSDTCVTPRWLDKMVGCFRADPLIAIASPLTNFSPHMNIPMLPGHDYIAMNALVEELSEPSYPDVTTPEGFCYMLRTSVIPRIGVFDEVFGDGYGEESDLAMRAIYFGYRTVCVDDTYIYHRGRATFGDERRSELYQANRKVFNNRWSRLYGLHFDDFVRRDPLRDLRARVAAFDRGRRSAYSS